MKGKWTALWAAMGMGVLILDTKTALLGAREGIEVCLQTVIPSLLPFFVLSGVLTGVLMGQQFPLLAPLHKLLKIPKEALALVIVGLLGGYPVGAKNIAQSYRQQQLHKADAQRMLAFCSNAGPAFLFGIGGLLFESVWLCCLVWAIHIASSFLVALLTPCESTQTAQFPTARGQTLPEAVKVSIGNMAVVCGWVVLFRILIAFADRWVLWMVSGEIRTLLIGFLELANGCYTLSAIESTGLRLVLLSVMLSFGGLCVAMQTASVCEGLSMGLYLPGKLCQGALSALLSMPAQLLLPQNARWLCSFPQMVLCCTVCVAYHIYAKRGTHNKQCGNTHSVLKKGSILPKVGV